MEIQQWAILDTEWIRIENHVGLLKIFTALMYFHDELECFVLTSLIALYINN